MRNIVIVALALFFTSVNCAGSVVVAVNAPRQKKVEKKRHCEYFDGRGKDFAMGNLAKWAKHCKGYPHSEYFWIKGAVCAKCFWSD